MSFVFHDLQLRKIMRVCALLQRTAGIRRGKRLMKRSDSRKDAADHTGSTALVVVRPECNPGRCSEDDLAAHLKLSALVGVGLTCNNPEVVATHVTIRDAKDRMIG